MPVLAAIITSIVMILTPHQRHLIHCHHVPGACSQPAAAPVTPLPPGGSSAVLAPLPVHTRLNGAEATAWSTAALHALGAPVTSANLKTMADWYANEDIPHDFNNPLNLQTPYGGSAASAANGDPIPPPPYNGIQAYPLPADFVAAFQLEMTKGSYPAIVAALRAGTGLEGTQPASVGADLGVYSGGGYHSIPAAYCPCGG